MTEKYIPKEYQYGELENPVEKLWWFAQIEKAIEDSDTIDREPCVGSITVVNKIIAYSSTNNMNKYG